MDRRWSSDLLQRTFSSAGFDGVWSPLGLSLAAKAKSLHKEQLRLSRNWVITPQSFVCEICGRKKASLAQAYGKQILACLHLDHDHVADLIFDLAKSMKLNVDIRPIVRSNLSYQDTVICKACNWIDSQIKIMVPKVHPYFSYPPMVKRSLIKGTGRSRHIIDKKAALVYWQDHAQSFEQKCEAIERDLQDCIGRDGALKGYKPRKVIEHQAFTRFLGTAKESDLDLSWSEFVKLSCGLQRFET